MIAIKLINRERMRRGVSPAAAAMARAVFTHGKTNDLQNEA
jgi:hypothetical protein